MSSSPRLFRFIQWNDLHLWHEDPTGPHRSTYPNSNLKARWALQCALGNAGVEKADFILSAGDLVHGPVPRFDLDFDAARTILHSQNQPPFFPCVGNHETCQGAHYAGYDRAFGPQWRQYTFTVAGVGFIVLDTSDGHRTPDPVTAARNQFLRDALAQLAPLPVFIVSHIPLIPMRDVEPLQASFGFSSWKVLDPQLLEIVEAHADRVIAVLSGHIHLTAARAVNGIHHIMPSGCAGFPADLCWFDVYPDRVDVQMQSPPDVIVGDRDAGNIHGRRRHNIDYTDTTHPDHATYLSGLPSERQFTIELPPDKRPAPASHKQPLFIQHAIIQAHR